jgi:nucleoside-diphosphate-sugar epimerase
MRVLILGGTVFLSAAVAKEYLERGHDVTCVSRSTNSRPPEGVREIVADRSRGESAYDQVRGDWDAVIDVATAPQSVGDALNVLANSSRHWTYVSSCSVYVNQDEPDCTESEPVVGPLDPGENSVPENYGASKSASEALCRDSVGDHLFIVRPGLIVGTGDPSDRGGYWPARFARGGEVLVPEAKDLWAQMIDVNDLARWIVACGETEVTGTMNAVGESRPLLDVLCEARGVALFEGRSVVVEDQWLVDHDVAPWAGNRSLPLWIPQGRGFDGFTRRSHALATHHGLILTPLEVTLRSVLGYEATQGLDRDRRAGLGPDDETQLIELWRSR